MVSGELDRINKLAGQLGVIAPVSFRVNPDVDANTHPYISTGLKENKFGIAFEQALNEYKRAARMPNVKIIGIDCHIGSQLTDTRPFLDALDRILDLVSALKAEDILLHHLDLGGGLGIRYKDEQPPEPSDYIQAVLQKLRYTDFEILLEPGRAIVGNAGILITRVEYLKTTEHKNFAIVDAAMDLVRPSLYSAWQNIIPVKLQCQANEQTWGGVALTVYDLSYTGAWGTAEIAIVNRARGTVLRAEAVDGRLELRTWEAGEGNISLVYTAGYATGPSEVPPDLVQLALELAWLMYREGARNGLESLAEVGASLTFVRLLSPSARAALNAYRARRFPWTMLG